MGTTNQPVETAPGAIPPVTAVNALPDRTGTDVADLTPPDPAVELLAGAKVLSPADILTAEDLPTKWVYVPGWKGKVLIRALSGTDRDFFESTIVRTNGKKRESNTENIRAKLCQLSIINPDNPKELMFSRKQIDALGKKSAADLDIVYTAAAELSGLSDKDVEELAGNSAAGSDGSSPS